MTIEELRAVYDAQPFRAFAIHLDDGRQIPVLSRGLIMASPRGSMLVVCQPDDTVNIIDLLLVTDLEMKPRKKVTAKSRK